MRRLLTLAILAIALPTGAQSFGALSVLSLLSPPTSPAGTNELKAAVAANQTAAVISKTAGIESALVGMDSCTKATVMLAWLVTSGIDQGPATPSVDVGAPTETTILKGLTLLFDGSERARITANRDVALNQQNSIVAIANKLKCPDGIPKP